MNFPLFIAKRISANGDSRRRVSRPAIKIATAGVAIGLAVMIVSVCVITGFKHTIRDKVVGFGSDIQICNFLSYENADSYPIVVNDSLMKVLRGIEGVSHVQRFANAQGIMKTDDEFLGVMFKGVGEEFDTTFIAKNIIEGRMPLFSGEKSSGKIVVSKTIADKLRLSVGNRVFAYFIDERMGVRARRFTVAAIYQTHLSHYDGVMCFIDLATAVKLNGWEEGQVSGAEVTVSDFEKIYDTQDIIINKVNRTVDRYGSTYSSKTIYDLMPQIFSWLGLLDINVWIILALMITVACVTMISGLLIIILERTQMIGLFKALGARNKTIRHTFLWFATFIIAKGIVFGNVVGVGLVALQMFTGVVKLDPMKYYVAEVPVEMNIPLILLLNVATLVISLIVLVLPSYLISHIHPARSMKYE